METYDCFTFFNELDLLDLRLNYLNEAIDHFVLVEADRTHSGNPKPYYYENNKERFKGFHNKIIHVKLKFNIDGLDFTKHDKLVYNGTDNGYWILEKRQRNGILEGLTNANQKDIIIISDLDEIPSIEAIEIYKRKHYGDTVVLMQDFHYYYFNCKNLNENWPGSSITIKNNFEKPQDIRDGVSRFKQIKNGGWHFSYLGGVNGIIKKIQSFAHSEYNNDKYLNKTHIINIINNGEDILKSGKRFIYFDLDLVKNNYPKYLIDNQEKFKKYIREVSKITL